MEHWLLLTEIQRLGRQIEALRTEIQRLAIVAALWSCVVLAAYHSETAATLAAEIIRSYLPGR